jgi:hypothetical protein
LPNTTQQRVPPKSTPEWNKQGRNVARICWTWAADYSRWSHQVCLYFLIFNFYFYFSLLVCSRVFHFRGEDERLQASKTLHNYVRTLCSFFLLAFFFFFFFYI